MKVNFKRVVHYPSAVLAVLAQLVIFLWLGLALDFRSEIEDPGPQYIKIRFGGALDAPQPDATLKEGMTEELAALALLAESKGSEFGNLAEDGKREYTYIDLLRLSVQEKSKIPAEALEKGISGEAVLRLTFDRKGFVQRYALIQNTGSYLLDAAAIEVAKTLMREPFPPVPTDFDRGTDKLIYDFPIAFDAENFDGSPARPAGSQTETSSRLGSAPASLSN